MSVATEIQRLASAKAAIKTSIENKGVEVGEGLLDSYAQKIDQIQSSGGDTELEASYKSLIDGTRGTNVTKLPQGLNEIGAYAFYYRVNMTLEELPETITTIGNYSFSYCSNLGLKKLPSGLTTIGQQAFFQANIPINEIPETVTSIGTDAFNQSKNAVVSKLPEGLMTLGNGAFNTAGDGITIKELPIGITTIGSRLFYQCKGITEMTCLGNITKIDIYAFSCPNLVKIAFPNVTNVPTLSNTNAFAGTPIGRGTGYIYTPDNLVNSFKSASNWSTFASVILPISQMPIE